MEKKASSPVTIGLLIALVIIAFSVVLNILTNDLKTQQKFGYVSFIVLIGGIIYACTNFAKERNGNVTFGNVFGHGFKVSAVVTCIMVVFTILSVTVLFPEMTEKGIEMAREQMEEQGQLSESQIDQSMEMARKFMIPFAIGGTLIGYLAIGAIGSLIGAGVARKNPHPTPF